MTILILFLVGCAKYNTFYNAKKSFDQAERVRDEAIRKHEDPPKPVGTQKSDYDNAIRKAQKVLDEYPGHSLTDDALFLQAKSYYRLESYRMSIRKFDLMFTNFPQTPYLEESLYLTALDYLLIGAVDRSQEYLDRLAKLYPDSKFQAETRKVSGNNSFAMEDWDVAAENYRAYLELDSDIEERDRIGLKLAECYWELEDYVSAAEVLQEVSNNTSSADLGFQAKLLRARVHVRMGDFEVADMLLVELRSQASIYRADGEVLLVEAESLVLQGKGDEASPLLESMPTEWETPVVKARAADLLGYLYLQRGEWEEARTKFQTALLKRDELDDENRTRRLNDNLKDYLAADIALPDAQPDRIPGLKLLQANAMLFGFDHPGVAADLYIQAAADTAADSTVAARALFGAYITYDQYLDNPDSASIFARELEENYPESPQAFEVRSGQSSNLLGYLMARQESEQRDRYANLSEEEKTALNQISDFSGSLAGDIRGLPGIRRRMVFLSRRPNILFEPPDRAVQSAQLRQAQALEEATRKSAARDSVRAAVKAEGVAVPDSGGVSPGPDPTITEENQVGPVEEAGVKDDEGEEDKDGEKGEDKEDKEEDDKKKKKEDDWDVLR
ncbi:MAG: tetratricopeptide repeat protein [Candidatus Krumholzibacteria bacterium]|nr:tetratricopeptide repeat protein [Candidatus Krumholzibacteria bacterium]